MFLMVPWLLATLRLMGICIYLIILGGRHAIKYPGDLENNGVVHLPHYSQADVALGAPQNTGEVHLSQYLQVPWRPVPWRP